MRCETHPAILHQILKYALSPRILEAYRAVLELLAYELDVLVVLFTVCPILLVFHAVAACALQLFHVLAVNRALELDSEVARICRSQHPAEQLGVAIIQGLHADVDASAAGDT